MIPKLTAAQTAVLRELAKPGAYAIQEFAAHPFRVTWRVNGKLASNQVRALANAYFIRYVDYPSRSARAITPEGRAYLSALDADSAQHKENE